MQAKRNEKTETGKSAEQETMKKDEAKAKERTEVKSQTHQIKKQCLDSSSEEDVSKLQKKKAEQDLKLSTYEIKEKQLETSSEKEKYKLEKEKIEQDLKLLACQINKRQLKDARDNELRYQEQKNREEEEKRYQSTEEYILARKINKEAKGKELKDNIEKVKAERIRIIKMIESQEIELVRMKLPYKGIGGIKNSDDGPRSNYIHNKRVMLLYNCWLRKKQYLQWIINLSEKKNLSVETCEFGFTDNSTYVFLKWNDRFSSTNENLLDYKGVHPKIWYMRNKHEEGIILIYISTSCISQEPFKDEEQEDSIEIIEKKIITYNSPDLAGFPNSTNTKREGNYVANKRVILSYNCIIKKSKYIPSITELCSKKNLVIASIDFGYTETETYILIQWNKQFVSTRNDIFNYKNKRPVLYYVNRKIYLKRSKAFMETLAPEPYHNNTIILPDLLDKEIVTTFSNSHEITISPEIGK